MARIALISLLLPLLCLGKPIVLEHVRLIDGAGGAPVEDATIVMDNGKIHAIGPSSRVSAPSDADVIDLSGKTVVPGIINLHGHVGNVKGLEQARKHFTRENVIAVLGTYASYGVTTTTSMGTDEDSMIEFRDERERNAFGGARIFTALQGFTTRGGYPTHVPGVKGVAQEVASASQAKVWVDKLADKGANIAKMWVDSHHGTFAKIPPAVYKAIIKQAHKRGMLAFAHLYELEDAKGLVGAGLDVIAHSVRDQEVDDELISLLIKNDVTYAATLTREKSTYVYNDPPDWLNDKFLQRSVDAAVIKGARTQLKAAQSDPKLVEQGHLDFEMASKNLKKLADAGVQIGFGTDTGPPGRFAGYFEHWEAELMVAAGMKPIDVIKAWSKTSAEGLEIDREFGTLEQGKAADLVVLDENPLDDIRNTRSIHAVYIGGEKFEAGGSGN